MQFEITYPRNLQDVNIFILAMKNAEGETAYFRTPVVLKRPFIDYCEVWHLINDVPTLQGFIEYVETHLFEYNLKKSMLENDVQKVSDLIIPLFIKSDNGFKLPLFDHELKYN